MNDKYVLPQAAQGTLGGIKAAAVEDKYTQECRIDKETGKLYTRSADRFLIEDTFEGNPVMSSSCREGSVSLIEAYGQSTQVTTTGKNLINVDTDIMTGLINFVDGTFSDLYNQYISTDFIKLPAGQYAVSTNSFLKIHAYAVYSTDKSYITGKAGVSTLNLENESLVRVSFASNPLTDISNDYVNYAKKSNIQLEKGSIATSYEPYTGGAPSPSPDYPQEIKSSAVTGVKVTGKNLFDPKKLSGGEFVEFNGVRCYKYVDNSKNFTFDFAENKVENLFLTIKVYRGAEYTDKKISIYVKYSDDTKILHTFENNTIYNVSLFKNGKKLKKITGSDNWLQSVYIDLTATHLEIGGKDTFFQPYKEQSIQLSAPITLRGIPSKTGNITIDGTKYLSDYIGQKEGMYGIFRNFFVYEVTGNEDFTCFDGTSVEKGSFDAYLNIRKYVSEAKIDTAGYVKWGLCNNLIFNSNSWAKKGEIGFCYNYGQLHIRVKNETISATQEMEISQKTQLLKNYLKNLYDSGTPMIFLYPLTTESFEPLPEPDQQALKGLKTFYPTSIITLETEDGAGVWGKAILKQDMKLYIQNKVKELSNNSITQIQNINLNLIR